MEKIKETTRISKLFEDLYNGSPWIDVNIQSVLAGISAAEASTKIFPKGNSIWEILNHLIQWRLNVLQRVQGTVMNSPDDNYFVPVTDQSEEAWKKILQELESSQEEWTALLSRFDEKSLERTYPDNNMTYYEHIHGILQHDAYHLGQIVQLSKMLEFSKLKR